MFATKFGSRWRVYVRVIGILLCLVLEACATKSKGTVKPAETNPKNKIEEDIPKLTRPSVRRIWVPPQVKENGTIYEEGYWRYLIEKESVWSR